jgi:hypothetical protein
VTFVIRTHDGRFAKLAILDYYCPGAEPGCVTLVYTYQGGGGTNRSPHPVPQVADSFPRHLP